MQGIMVRTFAHEIVEDMAHYAGVPVINGLTDYSHPCQAMADYLTMWEIRGNLDRLKIAYVGDGNNVAHSLMFAGAQLGADIWVATPPGYEPRADAIAWAQSAGQRDRRQLSDNERCERSCCWSGRDLHRRMDQHGPGSRSREAA